MSIPAVRAFKRALPDESMSMLAKPWVSPLFENDPYIDEIILLEERHKGLMGKFKLASELRQMDFNRALLMQNAFSAALTAFLARIPERIGYNRDGRGLLLTKPIPYNGQDLRMHHIDYYMELVKQAGFKAAPSIPWIFLTLGERLSAREILKALPRPILGINPGAAYGSAKQWLTSRFADTARRFMDGTSGSIVIFGGQKETAIAGEIESHLRDYAKYGRVLNTAGGTTLRELIGLISEIDVLLTNDSGPMHIGYGVRTPMAAIFGSTSPELTGPVGEGNIVIQKPVSCGPCFKRKCDKQSIKCMEAVEVDEVADAIMRLMPSRRAVFFDRDGTLCVDAHFLNCWEDFELFSDIGALNSMRENFKLIGISNQSGIARGLVDAEFADAVNKVFINDHGFTDFYTCPHHPDDKCSCRKPEPELLLKARVQHGIDLKRSYVVGDRDADMLLAKSVGAKGVLVQTGKQQDSPHADYTVKNLSEAAAVIAKNV